MKRNLEKVREMLFEFAEGKGRTSLGRTEEDLEYTYHLEIMRQAGLISYKEQKHKGGMLLVGVPQLTWFGNDYLDAISNEGVWNRTKEAIRKQGVKLSEVPLDIVVDIAKLQIKSMFGLE